MGKAIQEQNRRREDEEARNLAEERRKDKEEEKEARERVRRQIEQDRLDRAAKFNAEKERQRRQAEEERNKRLEEEAARARDELVASSSVARVQFRLPDGGSRAERFDPDAPLSELYSHVEREVRPGFAGGRFSLSTTFPSRQLDSEDRAATLRQLGLVPTATVLVLPPAGARGTRGAGGGGTVQLLPHHRHITSS